MFHSSPGASVSEDGSGGWRLQIPAGPAGQYRLAQIDDTTRLARRSFLWRPPLKLALQARASAPDLPGTWGFGLWNDPFSLGLGIGGAARRLPDLPQAAWFFFASPPNYLSLRDDLPARGFLAAAFRSARLPTALLAAGAPGLALLLLPGLGPPAGRLLRRLLRRFVRQEAALAPVDPTAWHSYALEWQSSGLRLLVDGQPALQTSLAPAGGLGLVVWIDNQYAAFAADGRLRSGSLANPQPAWLKIRGLALESG